MTGRIAYIVGKGGHAHVIRSLIAHERIVFLVDRDPAPGDMLQDEFFAAPGKADADLFIGIGDDAVRRAYFDRARSAGLRVARCIAPTAWIAGDASIGEGAFIGAGAVVGARAKVGENVIVNTLASVDHDCEVGDDTQIAPGAMLGGGVAIGRGAFLGMRSCVLPRIRIGDGAVLMAGALVTRDVVAGSRVGGLPARIVSGARNNPEPPARE